MADKFFIAPYDTESGLQNNVRPWLIPDTAFAECNNAYVWRGRVRKRFGSRWLDSSNSLNSRLRVSIGTTDGSGNFSGFVPLNGFIPIVTPEIGQLFSVGTQVFTADVIGFSAALLISGTASLATFNFTTGAVRITGAAITSTVYYYPSLPVMGLLTYEQPLVSDDFIIGFDTRFAYQYVSGWARLYGETTPGAASWAGDNTNFFWSTTWRGAQAYQKIFFVTNDNPAEQMRFFDGANWDFFKPPILSDSSSFLLSAQILVVFKNRLLALNTYEGGSAPGNLYSNRCRYSKIGSPLDADAWYQDVPGKGNAIDAPTSEAIVTALFVKDRLIVYFEKSTWELVFLGNQAFPFGWQKINTDLGAESSFTIVALESQAIGIGNVGIHTCNGSTVTRIDQKIPDLVFDIHEVNGGIQRVYGIRDFQNEMLYWTYVGQDGTTQQPYPDKVLTYNYRNDTWGINDDSITCFGYFLPVTGVLWDSETVTWSDPVIWGSGLQQAQQRVVVAGNQEGYTFIIDADESSNASVLQITNFTALGGGVFNLNIIDHNLRNDDYIYINSTVWSNAADYFNGQIVQVNTIFDGSGNVDPNNVVFTDLNTILFGTYLGAGTVATVSLISIKTKEYNFYASEGKKASVTKAEFLVDTTNFGEMLIDFYVSTNQNPFTVASGITGTLIGTGTLDTYPYTTSNSAMIGDLEANSERIWHPVYFQAMGNAIQLQFTMNYEQMTNPNISYYSDFQLHALCFTAKKLGDRLE